MIGKIKMIMEKKFDGCEVWGIAMDQISKVRSVSKKSLSTKDFGGVRFVKTFATRESRNTAEMM